MTVQPQSDKPLEPRAVKEEAGPQSPEKHPKIKATLSAHDVFHQSEEAKAEQFPSLPTEQKEAD